LLRQKVIVLVAVLAIACLVPIPYLAAPRWEVSVVGEDGKPLSGISVRLVYQNYPAERREHEITLATDEHGHVLFPAQFQKASLVQRASYALWSLNASPRASYGRQAFVFAFSSALGGNETNELWRGSPASMESKIVAKGIGMDW
jgi:hypothetical protein